MVLGDRLRMRSSQRRRQPLRVALVVLRHDLVLQEPVEVLRVGPVLGALVGESARGRRSPSR